MKPSSTSEYSFPLDGSMVSDVLCGYSPSLFKRDINHGEQKLRLLSLFSGCGGMDIANLN